MCVHVCVCPFTTITNHQFFCTSLSSKNTIYKFFSPSRPQLGIVGPPGGGIEGGEEGDEGAEQGHRVEGGQGVQKV